MFSLRFFRDYYGIPYPDAKMDMVAMPDFAQGAMENTGCIMYRESLAAGRSRPRHAARAREHRRRRRPRARAPVVRQPRDDALVERDLAQRGVRDVHGAPDRGRDAPGLGALGRVRALRERSRRRWTRSHSTRAIEYPVHSPARHRRDVRRADLPEGRRDPADDGALPRRRSVPRRDPPLPARSTRFGNTETHDLWDAIEDGHRRAGPPDHGSVDLAGRLPDPGGGAGTDRRMRVAQRRFLSDGAADATTWEVPLRVRELGGGRAVVPGGRPPASTCRAPPRRTWWSNAGAASFVRVHYAAELRDRLTGRLPELTAARALRRSSTTCGPPSWRARPTRPISSRFAERFGAEDDLAVWQALPAGPRVVRPVHGRARRASGSGRSSAACSLPRSIGCSGRRMPEDPDRVRALRGALLQALGHPGRRPERAGGRARVRGRGAGGHAGGPRARRGVGQRHRAPASHGGLSSGSPT